jgi:hypothetical protein
MSLFVNPLYPLIILRYSVTPTKCCSAFYGTLPIIQTILWCWLPHFILSHRDADLRQVSFFIYTVNCIWLWTEGQRWPYRPCHAQVCSIVNRRYRSRCYYDNGNLPLPYVHTCAVLACSQILTTLVVLRLPIWFPGATFKRASVECLRAGHDMKEIAFQDIKERMVNHISPSKGTINWLSGT